MNVGLARFPFVRDVDGFDFAAQPSIDKKQIRELTGGRFIANAEAVLLARVELHRHPDLRRIVRLVQRRERHQHFQSGEQFRRHPHRLDVPFATAHDAMAQRRETLPAELVAVSKAISRAVHRSGCPAAPRSNPAARLPSRRGP
jgi:hypothetical protein